VTQQEALNILKLGFSTFLTGPAGSGKTFLLNKYIEYLKTNKIQVGVTASTGIASTHINGRTIHSWSGLKVIEKPLTRKDIDKKIKHLFYNEDLIALYKNTKVLIIDEISMLDAEYLDLINTACQAFRQSLVPFGGIQLVLCGDFFQLPPVSTEIRQTEYAFKAKSWRESNFKICYLDKQPRYIDDKFVEVLNDIRHSKVNERTIAVLKSRINQSVHGSVRPTRLYTKNIVVDSYNNIELDNLSTREQIFTMCTYYKEKEHRYLRDHLVKHCMAPYHLALKVGAVVMFVKNNFDDSGVNFYVNGTMGKVVSFVEEEELIYPVVEVNDGRKIIARHQSWSFEEPGEDGRDEVVASITQIPLRLAWAITVHKSQGLSMDEVVTDLSGAFEYGMGYVALSRVRSLGGLCLLGLNRKALEVNPEISELDDDFKKKSEINLSVLKEMEVNELKERQKNFVDRNGVNMDSDLLDMVLNN